MDENGNLIMDENMTKFLGLDEPKWRLVRENDGLIRESARITWIEFDVDGRFRDQWDSIGIGRSLLMSPFNEFFTWQTTTVTEIIESGEDTMRFKTKNSLYTLTKINN